MPKAKAAKSKPPCDVEISSNGRSWDVVCACGFATGGIYDHARADAAAEAHVPGSSDRHHKAGGVATA